MRKYSYIYPAEGEDISEQIWDVCDKLSDSEHPVVKLTFFAALDNYHDYSLAKKDILRSLRFHFGYELPAFSLVAQAPLTGTHLVAMECRQIDCRDVELEYKTYMSMPYVVAHHSGSREIIAAGLSARHDEFDCGKNSNHAFIAAKNLLRQEGMDFSNIVRQWNYIEDITGSNSVRERNYNAFNRVRAEYYSANDFNKGYPAATGIGVQTGGVIIDFIASDNPKVMPVDNPLQVPAHAYSNVVLADSSHLAQLHTPKFERAKIIEYSDSNELFISGTAAISGENSRESVDPAEQASITMENIIKLVDICRTNGRQNGSEISINLNHARVYLKNEECLVPAMTALNGILNNECVLFVKADVCREELLIEIECSYEII